MIRRLGGSASLPVAGIEVLLDRAVTAADLYAPGAERPGLRAAIASACLEGVSAAAAVSPRQRALAAGFAASTHSVEQLALVRLWLDGGSRPDGLAFDGGLRGSLLRTLAARGLAADDDLDALAAADPVAGEQNRATCRAVRPDAEALPALADREVGAMRHLARALYPATLAEPATLAATAVALERGDRLSYGLRLVLLEQQAILRSVLAARSVTPRWR